MNSQTVPAPIVVAVRSPRWRSQVQRYLEGLGLSPTVHWLPGFDSIANAAIAYPSAALIAELPDSFSVEPGKPLKLVANLCNNSQQCPLFLLGDGSTEPWVKVLAEAGATATCCSILDFGKICSQLGRHIENSATSRLSVEEATLARLPW